MWIVAVSVLIIMTTQAIIGHIRKDDVLLKVALHGVSYSIGLLIAAAINSLINL